MRKLWGAECVHYVNCGNEFINVYIAILSHFTLKYTQFIECQLYFDETFLTKTHRTLHPYSRSVLLYADYISVHLILKNTNITVNQSAMLFLQTLFLIAIKV